MSRAVRLVIAFVFVLTGTVFVAPVGDVSAEEPFQGRYIVLVDHPSGNNRAAVQELAQREQFVPSHVYEHAVDGFSAQLNDAQVRALERNPNVTAIVPDSEITLFAQTIPTGIERIGTLENETADINGSDQRVGIDVAILDTGIDTTHADLNVDGGYNCTSSDRSAYNDGHGHGTHVGGTVGALDNDLGVVGVAPGAALWGVKVLNDDGSGSWSTVICGLDWVAANSGEVDVANMSLGGSGSDTGNCGYGSGGAFGSSSKDPLHQAVCKVVNDHGVTLAVAAGNSGEDAGGTVPAAYPEVITTGAIVDTDGEPGGNGSSTSYGSDDTRASFSNYGSSVDIYAPGVKIVSTLPGNSYATWNGTSMASPHAAGAASLYLANNPGASPDEVRQAMDEQGVEHGAWDSYEQPLTYVANSAPTDPVYDLAVSGIAAPGTLFSDESADISVTVENVGNQTMSNVDVTLEIDGVQFDVAQSISLEAGESQDVVFTDWSPGAAGTYTLAGTVQHGDDTDTGNDSAQTTVEVSDRVYDLSVTSVAAPSSVTQGQSATVDVQVKNESTQTETISVSLGSDPVNAAGDPADQEVPLASGASQTVSFTWQTSDDTTAGDYELTATASIDGQSVEASGSVSITVTEKSDASEVYVEDLTTSSSRSVFGYKLSGTATIFNDSGEAVQSAEVTISISSSSSSNTVKVTTDSNGKASLSQSVSKGTYTVKVENVSAEDYEYDSSLNKKTSVEVQVQ